MKPKSCTESMKRRQCAAINVPFVQVHRSHVNGVRWIRAWNQRNHQREMKALKEGNYHEVIARDITRLSD